MKVLFIDFEDSFTYNIIQELERIGLKLEVKKYYEPLDLSGYSLTILGPGPGHPDDYQDIFPLVKNYLEQNGKIFGVCLGHQILGKIFGYEVKRSEKPLHGQAVTFKVNKEVASYLDLPSEITVQRYNSLAVFDDVTKGELRSVIQGEVLIFITSQIISYQFHPESLGTKCRSRYFLPILKYLL